MIHADRECPICGDEETASNRELWTHVALFVLLMVVGFAIGGYWQP